MITLGSKVKIRDKAWQEYLSAGGLGNIENPGVQEVYVVPIRPGDRKHPSIMLTFLWKGWCEEELEEVEEMAYGEDRNSAVH